ncbi:MAG: APC family permease [Candidatus Dormibacteria bacterium]
MNVGTRPLDPPPATSDPVSRPGVGGALRHNTLSHFDTTAVAVASVAPAYSLAATIFLLVAAVGLAAPAALLVSFIPVLFIAVAYHYMNRKDPNCGASYSWLASTVSPYVGWFNGWVQTAASVLFCIAAPALAGVNTLALLESFGWIGPKAAGSPGLTAVIGLGWLLIVSAMVVYGIRLTANFQWIMVGLEYLVVLGFSIAGIVHALGHPAGSRPISMAWFNPGAIAGLSGLAAGAVLGVFFFWGWDTAANLNEETKHGSVNAGRAGIISMFILLFIFLINAVAMQSLLPAHVITSQGGNALFYFAHKLAPAPLDYLMLLAILSSTVATTQTTLLPASRVTFSMARDGVFPKLFGAVHKRFLTPWLGTIALALVSALGLIITTVSPTVNGTFTSLINNIGVLVAFYYGITGIACFWAYRRVLTSSLPMFLLAGILPLLSGLFLFWVGYQVVVQAGVSSSLPILITFILGVPLVLLARVLSHSGFFKKPTVVYSLD